MNARDWTRRKSITSAGPAMKPPQLASDFENVPMRRSTRSSTPSSSQAPAPARAEHADAVRLVHHQPRAVLRAERRRSRASGATSPSIEKTPSTTTSTPPPSPAARSSIVSSLSSRLWRNGPDPGARHRHGVEDRGVVARVADHGVAGAEQRRDAAHVRQVAGGEDERVVGAHPLGDLALELEVQRDRPVQEARAGQRGAVLLERVAGGLLDALVAGQARGSCSSRAGSAPRPPSARPGPAWPSSSRK